MAIMYIFFFEQKTAYELYQCDWSSDVCSSDLTHVTGMTRERLTNHVSSLGPLCETFVLGELRKQATWARHRVSIFHYRTTTGREVDVILEDQRGMLVGIEIKASRTVSKKDFAGLEAFSQDTKKNFLRGILLYSGTEAVPDRKSVV